MNDNTKCAKCGGSKSPNEPLCHYCGADVLNSFKRYLSALTAEEVTALENALGADLSRFAISGGDVFDFAVAMHPQSFTADLRDAVTEGGSLDEIIGGWREGYKQEILTWLTS